MAAETSPPTFSIGVTYWPRRAGFGWWREFDRGAVREELAHVAALGCDTVRFCLSWEEFQPSPQRVNGGALATLEQALDLAGEAGLRVVAALFPVAMGGALWLPDWANGADPLAQPGVKAAIAAAEGELNGHGRLLIRKSGTEPLIRVMAEAEDPEVLGRVVDSVVDAVTAAAR